MTDHLFTATDGEALKLQVPYVCKESYQIGSFLLYPTTHGFEFNTHGFLVVREEDYPELPSLLQEWLYFGLLQEFLGRPVKMDEFVHINPSGDAILDSSPLTTYLQGWGRDKGTLEVDKLYSFIKIASEQCRYLDRDNDSATHSSLPALFLSIQFLIDTLVIAATEADDNIDSDTHYLRYPLSAELEYSPPSSSILLDHMVQNGWCRHRARWFCQLFTYNVIYYLASVPPNTNMRSHSGCEVNDHCVADNAETENYECRHVDKDCRCDYIATSVADVKAIIRDGGIPVISFSETPTGVFSQRVIRAEYSTKYVAVSHVSKDGLGNPRKNALPKCQIQKLVQTIKESLFWRKQRNLHSRRRLFRSYQDDTSEPPVNIWMDTLCVPIDDASLRMKAINRMTPSYKRAAYVMVLDSGLSAVPKRQVSSETCADLLMSAWNGRSWTLQEGALARELHFPASICPAATFWRSGDRWYVTADHVTLSGKLPPTITLCSKLPSDAPRALTHIHRRLHTSHQLPSVGRWSPLSRGGLLFPSRRESEAATSELRKCQFRMVWNALLGRTTTMVQDTHGIIANLLDFKAEEILLLQPKDRMRAMLCAQESLPIQILYDRSPRILAAGPLDRWAPDNPNGGMLVLNDHWMDVTGEGLLISPRSIPGRTIFIQHAARTFRLGRYYLHVEGFGQIEVTHHSVSDCSYPELVHDTTLLHLVIGWESILSSRLTVSGASFALKKTEVASFRVYYDDPITLKLCESYIQNSSTLHLLHGTVISQPQSISIDIGIQNTYKPRHRRKLNGGMQEQYGQYVRLTFFVLGFILLMLVAVRVVQDTSTAFVVLLVLFCCGVLAAALIFYFYMRTSQGVPVSWLRTFDEF